MDMNLTDKDKQFVWHPFTQMKDYCEGDPVVVERAEGVFLYDTEGNQYYDGVSSLWVNLHGHGVEEIDRAIEDQLENVAHSTLLGQGSVPSIELAERLVNRTPTGLQKVFYSDSGATAVEIGMKMAIQYWANKAGEPTEKKRFLTFEGGYHGDTFGPMSIVPDPEFHWPFEILLPDPIQVPFPHVKQWPGTDDPGEVLSECLEKIESKINQHEDELAGLVVEPVQGAGGMIVPPDGFLGGLRELTRDRKLFLMVDEVATGFGRTGELFACDHEGVSPDIMTLGKGITGGYLPVAATLATEEIYRQFLGERKEGLLHGHSYTGNALGCAAACASLDLLMERLSELSGKIKLIKEQLEPLGTLEGVHEFRQKGFMIGVELESNNIQPAEGSKGIAWDVCDEARQRGMLLRPLGSVVVFMPPLASTEKELDEMITVLEDSVRAVAESH